MSQSAFWFGRASLGLAAVALLGLGLAMFGSAETTGQQFLRAQEAELDKALNFLRKRWRGHQVLQAQMIGMLLAVGLTMATGALLWLSLVPMLLWLPSALLRYYVAKRIASIEEQIELWLVATANAVRATPSIGEAISYAIGVLPNPISEELDHVVKEYNLGTPLDEALIAFSERVGSRTLAGAVMSLNVARKMGGNLPEMLEQSAASLRELARLEGVVRMKTAEGKAQAAVIGAIPLPMVALIHMIEPGFFSPLADSFSGNLVLGGAATAWLLAILLSRQILAVDV